MKLEDLAKIPPLPVPGVAGALQPDVNGPNQRPQPAPPLPFVNPFVKLDPTQIIDNRYQVPGGVISHPYTPALSLPAPTKLTPPPTFPKSQTLDMLQALAKHMSKIKIPKGVPSVGGGGGTTTTYGGGPAQPGLHGSLVYGRSAADLPSQIPNLRTIHGATMQAPAIASLIALHKATGAEIFSAIGSSYRSYAQQVGVYNHNHPLGLPAAPPGSSYHEQGLAMDLNSGWVNDHPEAMQWLSDHGWHSGASFSDPYHWTYGVIG